MTVRRWAPPIAWAVFILILTSLPGSLIGALPSPTDADKLVHFTMYGVLGLLAARSALSTGRGARALLVLLLSILLLAAMDEVHQHFIPGRSMDVHDWMADALGAAAGIAFATVRRRTREHAA